MDINTLYSVKIAGYNNIFKESVRIYRDTVDSLIPVCSEFKKSGGNSRELVPEMKARK